MRHRTLNFLTDFGLDDEFVAVVKSVVWDIAPDTRIVDITHAITPFDVKGAGLTLARAASWLNPGVVLAVVDPGVGSSRRAVAVEVGGGASVLVGPDNGLLAPAVAMVGGATAAVDISNSPVRLEGPGATFDGRDLFGPVAAHLCMGADLQSVGTPIDPAKLMPAVVPVSALEGDVIVAEVLWVDRFGNAQLNLDPDELDGASGGTQTWSLQTEQTTRPVRRETHFDRLGSGELGLITDSAGMISVALSRASAAREFGLAPGTEVRLIPAGSDRNNAAGQTTPVTIGRKES